MSIKNKIHFMKKDHIPSSSFQKYWERIKKVANVETGKSLYTFRRTVAQRVYDSYRCYANSE